MPVENPGIVLPPGERKKIPQSINKMLEKISDPVERREMWMEHFRQKREADYAAEMQNSPCKHSRVRIRRASSSIEGTLHHAQCGCCPKQATKSTCFCETGECLDRGYCEHNEWPLWVTRSPGLVEEEPDLPTSCATREKVERITNSSIEL